MLNIFRFSNFQVIINVYKIYVIRKPANCEQTSHNTQEKYLFLSLLNRNSLRFRRLFDLSSEKDLKSNETVR